MRKVAEKMSNAWIQLETTMAKVQKRSCTNIIDHRKRQRASSYILTLKFFLSDTV
jgi:hypothetical protein